MPRDSWSAKMFAVFYCLDQLMIMVKRMIIYWFPRGNRAVFPAQWSVKRFEIFEAPEATRKIYTSQCSNCPVLEICYQKVSWSLSGCYCFIMYFYSSLISGNLRFFKKIMQQIFDFFFIFHFLMHYLYVRFSCHFLF